MTDSQGAGQGAGGPDELRGFGIDGRRAVALAESEARGLRHDRVGTEHLLLGVLALDGTAASARLHDAGITLAAARHKVAEAVPQGDVPPPEPMPRTERAARALGRSHRFSHATRSATVGPEHILLGVLDVEGTAGQVLRGLGADVERLRTVLRTPPPDEVASDDPVEAVPAVDVAPVAEPVGPSAATAAPVVCLGCGAVLDDGIEYRVLIASGSRGPREVVAYSCRACGRALGAGPV
jgi:hypothetical protein